MIIIEKINYYTSYKDDLILRDILATDRTILANERIVLAYIRAFLNFVIAGVSVLKIFNSLLMKILGITFIFISFFFLIIGIKKYLKLNKALKSIRNY